MTFRNEHSVFPSQNIDYGQPMVNSQDELKLHFGDIQSYALIPGCSTDIYIFPHVIQACISYPFSDSGSGVWAAYGSHALVCDSNNYCILLSC